MFSVHSPRQGSAASGVRPWTLPSALTSAASAAAIVALALLQPSGPGTAPEAATGFSVARALNDLRTIASQPHPVGTPAHRAVGDYIIGRITAAGATPETQEMLYLSRDRERTFRGTQIRNILARLPGQAPGRAALFLAHYDSAITSPGAADNAAGVAALLEAIRVVNAAPGRRHDLIFLFSDAEEPGLLGAKAFAAHHPWFKDVGVAINFEARGTSGASVLFETGDADGAVVRTLSHATQRPVMHGFAPAVYELLPNNTDLTVFRDAGIPSLNFAFADGWEAYHTALDRPDRLDPRSLQHHGAYAVDLARSFARDGAPGDGNGERLVYFNGFGSWVVLYPAWTASALGIIVALAFVTVVGAGLVSRRFSIRGIVSGCLRLGLAALGASVLLGFCWWWTFGRSGTGESFAHQRALYVPAIVFCSLGFVLLAFIRARRANSAGLLAGAAIWWVGAAVWTAISRPSVSYLFTWPALVATVMVAILAWSSDRGVFASRALPTASRGPDWRLLAVSLLPVLVMPMLVATMRLLFLAAPSAEFLVAGAIVLTSALFVPHLRAVFPARYWAVAPVMSIATGVLLLSVAYANSRPSASAPKSDSVTYVTASTAGKTAWLVRPEHRDSWTMQFLGSRPNLQRASAWLPEAFVRSSFGRADAWVTSAPDASVPAPALAVQRPDANGRSKDNGAAVTILQLASRRAAPELWVQIEPEISIDQAFLNDRPLDPSLPVWQGRRRVTRAPGGQVAAGFILLLLGLPPSGVTLRLDTREPFRGRVDLVDRSYELPPSLVAMFRARPSELIAGRPAGDTTVASSSYSLDLKAAARETAASRAYASSIGPR